MSVSFRIMVFMILTAAVITPPVKAISTRRLEDTTPANGNPAGTGSPNGEVKCGSCPCGTTCYSSPPPPSPSPPPPSPSPPPPSPKKPSPTPGLNCPPPPSGGGGGGGHAPPNYIYITGPPGDLYPVVQSVSTAGRSFTAPPPPHMVLIAGLLLGMIAYCW